MSQKSDITDLTICRAAFAAWVFIYHVDLHLHFSRALGPFSALITHGCMGVDGFFILSGLVLLHTHREFDAVRKNHLHKHFRWAGSGHAIRFYAKRLARIYPVHLATILILLRGFVEQPCRRAANRWLQSAPAPAPSRAPALVTEKPQSLF